MAPFEKEIHAQRLGWFIHLRWAAVAGGIAILLGGPWLLPLSIQYGKLALCVAALGVLNAAYLAYWRRLKTSPQPPESLQEKMRILLHFQMMADLALLTMMLFFSGGAQNPLLFFYLFHVAISTIIFSISESLFYLALALVLPFSLLLLEVFNPAGGRFWPGPGFSVAQESSILLAYSVTVVGLWFFLTRLSSDLRGKENALRETSRKLFEANADLQQLDIYKNQFLRQVVFQLKTPAIDMDFDLSSVEKALSGKNEKALEAVQTAKKRVWSLLELIDDLTWLSRLEVNEKPFKREWVDVYESLVKDIQGMEAEAGQKGITFQIHGDPQIRLRADQEAFNRVAANLLSNAVKYTPAGTHKVLADLRVEGDWLVFSVQDEGIGIPPKQQEKIFEEFFRATNARKLEKFGTGLGLVIVKNIMDWHGGRIVFSSETKRGTKVETWWPYFPSGEKHQPGDLEPEGVLANGMGPSQS